MSSEIRFVQEVEKHECLYNNFLPEYSRKDLNEAAWASVAAKTDLRVSDCKEKWRNIRSSLLRSLRPSERPRKPYYLTPFLNFILPFMKPLSNEVKEDHTHASKNDADFQICAVKDESPVTIIDGFQENDEEEIHYEYQPDSPLRKRKCVGDQKTANYDESENKLIQNCTSIPKTNTESMQYFLMSLIPDIETMTEEQSRLFKIKVMMLIGDIKSNFEQVKADMIMTPNESNRLQKRLINVLLKNLKNKT